MTEQCFQCWCLLFERDVDDGVIDKAATDSLDVISGAILPNERLKKTWRQICREHKDLLKEITNNARSKHELIVCLCKKQSAAP